jgi:hypothetical protein
MRPFKLTALLGVVFAMILLATLGGRTAGGVARAGVGDSAPSAETKIAICQVIALVDELMESDRFAPARAEHEEELRDELIRPLIEQGKSIETDLRNAAPDDPANNERKQRLIELRELILPQAQHQAGIRLEQFVAGQTIDAYALVAAAAKDVAAELGYTYLLATDPSERSLEELRGMPMGAVQQAILSRPVLLFPESTDISDAIRDDLNLD